MPSKSVSVLSILSIIFAISTVAFAPSWVTESGVDVFNIFDTVTCQRCQRTMEFTNKPVTCANVKHCKCGKYIVDCPNVFVPRTMMCVTDGCLQEAPPVCDEDHLIDCEKVGHKNPNPVIADDDPEYGWDPLPYHSTQGQSSRPSMVEGIRSNYNSFNNNAGTLLNSARSFANRWIWGSGTSESRPPRGYNGDMSGRGTDGSYPSIEYNRGYRG